MIKVKINQSGELKDDIKFGDDTDVLKREDFGESLANLILNSKNESLVISVNAEWGEGKTDFLKRWNNYLKDEKKINTIYFNSFKNDYIEDPFLPLLGEVSNAFNDQKEARTKIVEKGKNILKGIMPLAGKIGARWIMKGNSKQVDDDIEELIEGDIAKEIENRIKSYLGKEKELNEFREVLEKNISKNGGQLVFIIDELDRCRPDFALRLLERIKHFFDIKGLYFVLGINKNQIKSYIKKIYGDIDGHMYLQKFIDIETNLTRKKADDDYRTSSDIEKFIEVKLEENKLIFNEKDDKRKVLGGVLKFFAEEHNLTLRQTEKVINYIVLLRKTIRRGDYFMIVISVILSFYKVTDEEIYMQFQHGTIVKDDILTNLKFKEGTKYLARIEEEVNFFFDSELGETLLYKYSSSLRIDNLDDIGVRKKVLQKYLDRIENFNI